MISPTIWDDPGFNKLSHSARLLFIGLFSNADDYGYFRADPGSVRRLVFGFDDINLSDVEKFIAQVKEGIKSLHFFEEGGEVFGHLLKWNDYQAQHKDRIQPSILPPCSICRTASDGVGVSSVSKLSKKVSKEPESLKKLRERFGKKHSI